MWNTEAEAREARLSKMRRNYIYRKWNVYREGLYRMRKGIIKGSPMLWQSNMQGCRRVKQELHKEIQIMEQLLRPHSSYLQARYPEEQLQEKQL